MYVARLVINGWPEIRIIINVIRFVVGIVDLLLRYADVFFFFFFITFARNLITNVKQAVVQEHALLPIHALRANVKTFINNTIMKKEHWTQY